MQELKKKHRKKPKKELERGAQKEQKNLTDITEEQLKVNIGIVRLGNMIKVIQIVMKVLLCMLAVLFSFLAILLHEAANWMLATWTNLSMEELVAQLKTPIQGTSHEVLWDFVETCIPAAVMAVFFCGIGNRNGAKNKDYKMGGTDWSGCRFDGTDCIIRTDGVE
ncbi:MAG: hypothetical protein ACLU7M_03575 [Mediterraneibacter gnavus]